MNAVAVLIFVAMVIYVAVLYPLGKLSLAATAVFLVAAILAVCAIPNLTHISHLIVKAGEYFSVTVDAQQAAVEAHTDATEVRQVKEQVQILAKKVTDAEARIAHSEQNVSQMQANVQQAYRALFAALLVSFETRNWIGILPPSVIDEVLRQLDALSAFGFPDPKERAAEWARVNLLASKAMQKPVIAVPSPAARPTPSPN